MHSEEFAIWRCASSYSSNDFDVAGYLQNSNRLPKYWKQLKYLMLQRSQNCMLMDSQYCRLGKQVHGQLTHWYFLKQHNSNQDLQDQQNQITLLYVCLIPNHSEFSSHLTILLHNVLVQRALLFFSFTSQTTFELKPRVGLIQFL